MDGKRVDGERVDGKGVDGKRVYDERVYVEASGASDPEARGDVVYASHGARNHAAVVPRDRGRRPLRYAAYSNVCGARGTRKVAGIDR